MTLRGKHILLGVTGSIAAYKAAMLVRSLVRGGAQVRVVMTSAARDFITPLTLATLSKHAVLVDNFDPTNGAWNSHVALGEWADYYLIAPATANTLAKMAGGIADNLLLTSYLSARCPVGVAPAMDLDMYGHAATRQNLETLRARGVAVIEPGEGELASGLIGKGRMADESDIVHFLNEALSAAAQRQDLAGKKFLVTAGATIEAIDPVRYISNYSTGKMGFAIAEALAARGGLVTLVAGAVSTSLRGGICGIEVVEASSAEEMYRACDAVFDDMDGAVFCAAVADYAPVRVEEHKVKHPIGLEKEDIMLKLRPTRDIAAEMGKRKRAGQVTVGFALESAGGEEAIRYALSKLEAKNLDAIVLNSLMDAGAGFGTDTNRVTIITDHSVKQGEIPMLMPLKSKAQVAEDIVDYISSRLI